MDEDVGQSDGERLFEETEQVRMVRSVAVRAFSGQYRRPDPTASRDEPPVVTTSRPW